MLPGDRGPAAAFLGPAVHLAGVGAGLDAQLRGPQVAGLVGPAAVEPGGDPGALGEQVSAAPGQPCDLGHGRQMPVSGRAQRRACRAAAPMILATTVSSDRSLLIS